MAAPPGTGRVPAALGAAIAAVLAGAATLAVLLAAAWLAVRPDEAPTLGAPIPVVAPAPLDPPDRSPWTAPIRIALRDIDITTTNGLRVTAPGMETVLSVSRDPRVHVRRLALTSPRIEVARRPGGGPGRTGARRTAAGPPGAVSPALVATGGDGWPDARRLGNALLTAIDSALAAPTLPPLRIGRLVVTDGALRVADGALGVSTTADGASGGAGVLLEGLGVRLTGARIGGGRTPRYDLAVAGRLRRGGTRARVTGEARPGAIDLGVDADPLTFSSLRPWVDGLPDGGAARLTGELRIRRDRIALALDTGSVTAGRAILEGRGGVTLGGTVDVRDARLRFEAVDLEALGVDPPSAMEGTWSGELFADGRDPVRVTGRARHQGPARTIPVAIDGRVGQAPLSLRLRLSSDSLGTARLAAWLREPGPVVAGSASVAIRPVALGLRDGPPVRARVRGTVDRERRLDLAAHVDHFDLAGIPTGGADLTGQASASLAIGGTVTAPVVGGSIRLRGDASAPGVPELSGVRGTISLGDGAARTDGVSATLGGGRLRLRGVVVPGTIRGLRIRGAAPGEARRVDVALEADSALVIDDPLATVRVSGSLRLEGPLDSMTLAGRVVPTGAVYEDFFLPDPGLDLDDPPYRGLASRAPWLTSGRLRSAPASGRPAGDDDGARPGRTGPGVSLDAVRGGITVQVTHGLRLLDEDSELKGTGEIRLVLAPGSGDDATLATEGVVALHEGFFTQFAQRFVVYGGALVFDGSGLMPRTALRSDYDDEALVIGDNEAPPWPHRFPPYQLLGYGAVGAALERATRYTLVPAGPLELARRVLLGGTTQPLEGWRPGFWRASGPARLLDTRAVAQGVPLTWSYTADRLYPFLPLDRAYLATGVVTVGPVFPGRMVVAPVVRGAVVVADQWELRAAQPLARSTPELRAVYRDGGLRFEAFAGPRFLAGLARDDGYITRRRVGVGVRWGTDY